MCVGVGCKYEGVVGLTVFSDEGHYQQMSFSFLVFLLHPIKCSAQCSV